MFGFHIRFCPKGYILGLKNPYEVLNVKKATCVVVFLIALSLLCVPADAVHIVVDGDPGDWGSLPPIITDPDDWPYDQIDIHEVYVTSEGSMIYFRIDVYDVIITEAYYRLFLDVDQDPGTGLSMGGLGAEYQLGLYNDYGSGMSTDYTTTFPVQAAYAGSTLEIGVNTADLGHPDAFDFLAFCNPVDSGYPPDKYTLANDQVIAIDGDPSDWAGAAFFLDATGDAVVATQDLWGCYVGSNGTHLLTMMNTTGVIDPALMGMIYVQYDMSMASFQGPLGGGWTVWEGGKALADLGVTVGDDVYVMFYLMSYDGDMAPDEGYVTYSVPVGGEILPTNIVNAIAPYVIGLVLIGGTGAILYRKRRP